MKTSSGLTLLRAAAISALVLGAGFPAGAAPKAAPAAAVVGKSEDKKAIPYKITRLDRLAIQVYGEPDLTVGNKRVEATGTINLMLVGDVHVYGLTVSAAADAIEKAYRDGRILRNPEVTVTVEEYAPRVVTVSGKVKYPGTVNLPPEQQWTIKDVITKVGGFDDTARGTAVRLIRAMPDGSSKVIELDVQSALLGKDKATKSTDASFPVEPDDMIYVPEKII